MELHSQSKAGGDVGVAMKGCPFSEAARAFEYRYPDPALARPENPENKLDETEIEASSYSTY